LQRVLPELGHSWRWWLPRHLWLSCTFEIMQWLSWFNT
jgi:hypothetical protein